MAEIPDIPEAACLLQTSGQLAYTIRTDHRYRYFGITGRTTHPDVDRFRADAGLLAPPFVAGAGGVRPPTTIRFAGDDISIPFGGEGDLLIEGHAQGMIRMKMHYLAADGRFYLTFWSSASKRPAEDAPATDHPEQEKE